jgi:Na+/H+-dicarboxylate symporter
MTKKKLALHWQILISLLLAVGVGIFMKPLVPYVGWMGDIFLRMLKMIVIPLVLTSIISGIASIGEEGHFGRLGIKTIIYYIATSSFAIVTGLIFVNIIRPGEGVDISGIENMQKISMGEQSLSDVLINIVPDNLFASLVNNELLSVIFFAILAGVFLAKLKSNHRKLLVNVFEGGFELFMQITMFVIKLAPFGIFGLIVKVVAEQEDFGGLIVKLGSFMLAVLLAIFVHSFITLPLITKFIGKSNPLKHFQNMSTPLLTAFSTASSAAALPLTMKDVHEKSGVSEKITNFTLPIGATVNMDGTAIYISAVVMFIAQAQGATMGLKEQFIILVTALLTSIGTAAIPMASLVIITIILDLLGLPFELMALILPVDRILDMFRTATNVWSDSCGAVVIAKSEGEELKV